MSEHAASGGFDLSTAPDVTAQEDQGIVVHIRDHEGELMYYTPAKEGASPKPCTITVVGSYSTRFKRVQESITTRALKRRGAPITGGLVKAQALEQVADCITEWEGWINKGKPFPYTKENAIALMRQLPYVQPQLEAAMDDHAAFFEKASGS